MTYDLCCETDTVNPCTDHCNVMLLSQKNDNSTTSHPFCYAHVLGIYHVNVIFTGLEYRDYQSRHLECLWVWWFEVLKNSAGWEQCSLDKGRFVLMHRAGAFSFIDPTDVL